MEEKEKFKANKRHNAPFLRALDVLMKEKNINQAQAAELLDTKSGTFSDYKSGKKKAGEEMYGRIARAFGGRLNMRYLTGESEYMMLANVPDEEILEYTMRDGNPDYDVQKKAKTTSPANAEPVTHIDPMSQANATISAYIEAIESLKRELRTKDELLAEKDSRLAEKDERIAELKAHNIELRHQLDQYQDADIDRYPFHIGTAEGENYSNVSPTNRQNDEKYSKY